MTADEYVTATAGTGWDYGVASASLGTPEGPFGIDWIDGISGCSAYYKVSILVDGVQVCAFHWEKDIALSKPVHMPITAAGPITIKISSSTDGATAAFRLRYRLY